MRSLQRTLVLDFSQAPASLISGGIEADGTAATVAADLVRAVERRRHSLEHLRAVHAVTHFQRRLLLGLASLLPPTLTSVWLGFSGGVFCSDSQSSPAVCHLKAGGSGCVPCRLPAAARWAAGPVHAQQWAGTLLQRPSPTCSRNRGTTLAPACACSG